MGQEIPNPTDSLVNQARDRTSMANFRTQLALDRTTLAWVRTTHPREHAEVFQRNFFGH